MKKIIPRQAQLELYIAGVIKCDTPKKSHHCLNICGHGKFHKRETGKDSCHRNAETCSLSKSGIRRVLCKPLTKKQQREWVNNELRKKIISNKGS